MSRTNKSSYRFLKRTLDILLSITLIAVFSPILILFSILIYFGSQGGVFYIQKRLGYRGRIFSIIKFRSMAENPERDISVQVAGNEITVTTIGKLMR